MKYSKNRSYRDKTIIEVETVTKVTKKVTKDKPIENLLKRLFKKITN